MTWPWREFTSKIDMPTPHACGVVDMRDPCVTSWIFPYGVIFSVKFTEYSWNILCFTFIVSNSLCGMSEQHFSDEETFAPSQFRAIRPSTPSSLRDATPKSDESTVSNGNSASLHPTSVLLDLTKEALCKSSRTSSLCVTCTACKVSHVISYVPVSLIQPRFFCQCTQCHSKPVSCVASAIVNSFSSYKKRRNETPAS